jgi:hypothetical protein
MDSKRNCCVVYSSKTIKAWDWSMFRCKLKEIKYRAAGAFASCGGHSRRGNTGVAAYLPLRVMRLVYA